jgi:predicted MFS family arabinose efflux permease
MHVGKLDGIIGRRSKAYSYFVVAVIWVVMLLRFVDIQIISVLLDSIRKEFHVSDTKLGLLGGTAFALFYGALGVPIAWLADRYNRRNIIAICLAMWSAMTALCGVAPTFLWLFVARLGVGFGEAGGIPPSYSLISNYFPSERRSTVFAILNSAVPAGVFSGYLIGGYINANWGWRATLWIIGSAGVLIALLVRFSLREPTREESSLQPMSPTESSGQTLRYLWNIRSYRHLVAASSIFTLGSVGSGTWIASFFMRVHHMRPLEVTTMLAFVYGGGGLFGVLLGGAITNRVANSTGDGRWQAWLPALSTAAILPFLFVVYLAPNPGTASVALIGTTLLMYCWMGPTYATIQSLVGSNRRAMAASVNLLAVNVLALGFGPLIVGIMSDLFNTRAGGEALRYSILTLCVVTYAWASVHFFLAGRTLRKELPQATLSGLRAEAA